MKQTASYSLGRGALALALGVVFGAIWGATIVPVVGIGVAVLFAWLPLISLSVPWIILIIHLAIAAILWGSLRYIGATIRRPAPRADARQIMRSISDSRAFSVGFALGFGLMWAGGVLVLKNLNQLNLNFL